MGCCVWDCEVKRNLIHFGAIGHTEQESAGETDEEAMVLKTWLQAKLS